MVRGSASQGAQTSDGPCFEDVGLKEHKLSTPIAICLDTQVFDGANYNFRSTSMSSFVKLCQERDLTLLLPSPIKDEIHRHMLDRAKQADAVLDKAFNDVQKKAPFLSKWDRYPVVAKEKVRIHTLNRHCREAFDTFCRQLKVEQLGYKDVQLSTIMSWYNLSSPPFGEGKKRKEFPDAVSLAILDNYAKKNNETVAVVSDDSDMQAGCDRFQNLLHFPSMSSLIESFLSEDKRVDLYLNLINAGIDDLNEVLTNEMTSWGVFRHHDRRYTREKDRVHGVQIGSFDIIGLGNHECTIAYSATFEAEHMLTWQDSNPYDEYLTENEEWVRQEYGLEGTAKVKFTADDQALERCDNIEVDTHDFEISEVPSRRW
jgi:hypothetical protein